MPRRSPCSRRLPVGALILLGVGLTSTAALADAGGETPLIEIAPPREVGREQLRILTVVTSERIERVDFLLDGRWVSSDRSFPFAARLDLRAAPRPRQLEAVAFDRQGAELARDLLQIGDSTSALRISISEVRRLAGSGWLEVSAEVVHPSTSKIERVDFYRGDRFAASTRIPPFRARFPTPDESSYVRAVAHLPSGDLAEGVRLLEAGAVAEALAVNMVEVYAMVNDRKGRPVTDLTRSDFSLHRGDRVSAPERFSIGDEVPLSVALVLDNSGSMLDSIDRVKQAARQFLEQALDEPDKALLVQFDSRPRLLQERTDDVERLLSRFDAAKPRGGSAVHDAILFGLLQLEDAPGRKALIVLTDGLDSGSQATADDCVSLARQMGVPIFLLSLDERREPRPSHRIFALRRLAELSGGRAYEIARDAQIPAAYREIDLQLRGQYLLGFSTESALSNPELDSLRLSVSDDRLSVRTILGGQVQIMD